MIGEQYHLEHESRTQQIEKEVKKNGTSESKLERRTSKGNIIKDSLEQVRAKQIQIQAPRNKENPKETKEALDT